MHTRKPVLSCCSNAGVDKWSDSGSTLKIEISSIERLDIGYERKRLWF